MKKRINYYPFGMPMPNRNVEGGYRYGYQGEYAEKDPETGLNAFQLRMWDSRIGRWLSPDPYGQYPSPYMGMDNNPVLVTDPDGGCTDCSECPSACGDLGIESIPSGQSIDLNIDSGYFMRDDLSSSMLGEVTVTANLSMQAYWRDVNALAVNLNKQEDLATGKSASIRMLEALENEIAQMPHTIQFDGPNVIAGGGAMDLIGGKGAINLFKHLKNQNVLRHIFRNSKGHVNPATTTTQNRYLNLFNSVASDAKNLVQTTNAAKINANVKTFHRTFNNGKQIWVETINGKIVNAGVNNIPR